MSSSAPRSTVDAALRAAQAVPRWFRIAPPAISIGGYALIGASVLGTFSLLDFVVGKRQPGLISLLWSLGLGIGAGAALGACLGVLLTFLYRLPKLLAAALHVLAGGLLGAWLVEQLGVLQRLVGREAKLAWLALGLAGGAGLALTLTLVSIQPFRLQPRGWLASRSWWLRAPACLGLVALVLGCTYVDREFLTGTYQPAHVVLRAAALLSAVTLLLVALPRPRHQRWQPATRRTLASVLLALTLIPVVSLTDKAKADLHALLEQPYSRLALTVSRRFGDPDWDGDSAILGGGDCNSFNSHVHQGAEEIPGNGIDDNCLYGDAADKLSAYAQADIPKQSSPLSVILISVDTLRADHMSLYGYSRPTTPSIDEWAKRAVVFEKAYTSGGWTSLALPSLFRGVYPRRLRWTRLYETTLYRLLRGPIEPQLKAGEKWKRTYAMPVEEPRKPLTWWLQRRGMRTLAVVDDGFSEFLAAGMSMDEGFDEYLVADDFPKKAQDDKGVASEVLEQLRTLPVDRPFFLWTHFFGPHLPSRNNPGIRVFGDDVADKYDHEIAYVDQQVGRVLQAIDRLQQTRPIAVVLTSDHGEVLRERTRNHGIDLLDRSVHIPLLIYMPGAKPRRVDSLASLVDITPTVLEWTETPAPGGMDGQSLVPTLSGATAEPRVTLAELWRFNGKGEVSGERIAAMNGIYKLIWALDDGSKTLVRQGGDTTEEENLLGQVDASELDETIGRYLEENSRVRLFE